MRRHPAFLLVIVLVAAAWPGMRGGAQAPPTAAPAIGTGLIAGQVLDAQNGKPIPDVTVNLGARTGVPAPPPVPGTRGAAGFSVTVISDSQGRFFFASLAAGTYTISGTKTGYSRVPSVAGAGATIELATGDRVTSAVVRLLKSATMSGTLRDESGDPIVGTRVNLARRSIVNGRSELLLGSTSTTDDRGMFRFGNLTPGDYIVCACTRDPIPFDQTLLSTLAAQPLHLLSLAGRALSIGADVVTLDDSLRTYAPVFYPNSSTVGRATVVILQSGEERTNLDMTVPLVRAARVTGRVIGAQSALRAESMFLVAADETAYSGMIGIQPVLVQPDGRFDFAQVPPGQYRFVVYHRETGARGGGPSGLAMQFVGARGAAMPTGRSSAPPPDEPPLWAEELFTVSDRSTVTLNVNLQRGLRVSGRVELIGAAPTQPAAPPGAPAQPLRFNVILAELGPVGRVHPNGPIGPDGRSFSIGAGAPGKYGISALAGAGYSVRSVTLGGVDVTDLPVDILRDASDLVITLSTDPRASITVTTPEPLAGQPPIDDVLLVFPADRRYWAFPSTASTRYAVVPLTMKGRATASNLPAGSYYAVLVPPKDSVDWQESTKMEALSRRAQAVTVLDGEKKTIEVKR